MKKLTIATLIAAALCLSLVAVVEAQVPDDAQLSGEQCKTCHPEVYEVWAGTSHPNSIYTVKESIHAAGSCLHCMSADFRWDDTLTVETAQYGVTCLACHQPHETPGDSVPAIADVAALCKDCHNSRVEEGMAADPGVTFRHPIKEMMEGYGAIGAEGTPSVHAFACNTCHLQGHNFVPDQSACDGCHGGAQVIEEAGKEIRDFVAAHVETEGLGFQWSPMYTNLTMLNHDDSGGIHNPAYALAIKAAAEAAAKLGQVDCTALPGEVAECGPVALPVNGGVPVNGPALLLLLGILALAVGLGSYVWIRHKSE